MAAGDTLVVFTALHGVPPTTRFATLDTYVDGSTPTQEWVVLDFDPGSTTEFIDFTSVMPGQYDGSTALEVVIYWSSDATSGAVKWDVAFKSISDDADDTDSKAFDTIQTVTATTANAAGEVDFAVIDFTNAEADGVQPDDLFVVRVERDSADAADDMDSNDAELHAIQVRINA